jgi:hypothetical protein
MKKTLTTLFALLLVLSFSFAQQVAREKVVLEIGTGTWCPFCPGASMGADDLIANGHDVAVIKYHNGDNYTNAASNARNSYYNVSAYPTAHFDGGLPYANGSASQSLYPQYLPRYNQKIAIPSSFTVDIEGTSSGLIDFNIDVTIEMVDPYSGSDIRLHCVITESDIQQYWQGQDHLNYVERMMLPTHSGIQLDFSGGNIIEQNYSFALDPSWNAEHCEIVIFLQENGSKVILQGSLRELIDMGNVNNYDASLSQLSNLPVKTCAGIFAPSFILRNNGNENLTSITLQYQVNNGELSTYDWTGDLEFLEEELIYLPEIAFAPEEENLLMIYSENPNGNPDQYPLNDTIVAVVPLADIVPADVNLILRTDNNPSETTWEVLDDMGNVVYSGGPYTQASQTIMESFELQNLSCYQFFVYDAGGDGLNSPGFFALYYGSNSYILQGVGDFGFMLGTDFQTDDDTDIDELAGNPTIQVYPNPFSDHTNIALTTQTFSHVKVMMFNILGKKVYESDEGMLAAGEHLIGLNAANLENGVYLIRLMVNDLMITERVMISK